MSDTFPWCAYALDAALLRHDDAGASDILIREGPSVVQHQDRTFTMEWRQSHSLPHPTRPLALDEIPKATTARQRHHLMHYGLPLTLDQCQVWRPFVAESDRFYIDWMAMLHEGNVKGCLRMLSNPACHMNDLATMLQATVAHLPSPNHPLWPTLFKFPASCSLLDQVEGAWVECAAEHARDSVVDMSLMDACMTRRPDSLRVFVQQWLTSFEEREEEELSWVERMQVCRRWLVPHWVTEEVFQQWCDRDMAILTRCGSALLSTSPPLARSPMVGLWSQTVLPERATQLLCADTDRAWPWRERSLRILHLLLNEAERNDIARQLRHKVHVDIASVACPCASAIEELATLDLFQLLVAPIDDKEGIMHTPAQMQWIHDAQWSDASELNHRLFALLPDLTTCMFAPPLLRTFALRRWRVRHVLWEATMLQPALVALTEMVSSPSIPAPRLSSRRLSWSQSPVASPSSSPPPSPRLSRRLSSKRLVEEAMSSATSSAQQGDFVQALTSMQEVLDAVVTDVASIHVSHPEDPERVCELERLEQKLRGPTMYAARQYREAFQFSLNEMYVACMVKMSGHVPTRNTGAMGTMINLVPDVAGVVRPILHAAVMIGRSGTHMMECRRAISITMLASDQTEFAVLAREIGLRVATSDETLLRLRAIEEEESRSSTMTQYIRRTMRSLRRSRADTKIRETARDDALDLVDALEKGEIEYDMDAIRASEAPVMMVATLMARLAIERAREAESRRQRDKVIQMTGRGFVRLFNNKNVTPAHLDDLLR
jgi:hypothetical protein